MTTTQDHLPPRVPGRFRPVLDLRRNVVEANERNWREYGDVVRMVIGPPGADREFWMVNHPDAAARVLGGSTWRSYSKGGPVYDEVRYWLGDGLLTANGDEWSRQKRFVQPLFTKAAVDGYAGLMVDEIARSLDGWPSTATIDLGERMLELTARVVVRALFGDSADEAVPQVQQAFPPVSHAVVRRALAALRLPASVPTPMVRRARAGQAVLYRVCDEIISHRRSGTTAGEADLLGRLLSARDGGEGLTDAEVRDQILVFLLAGYETTSIALTFALHLLGRHPDVQQAVREEVAACAERPTASDMQALPLTEAVLKETMRLFPSAPVIARLAVADDVVHGYPVRAGVAVGVCVWNLHRRADVWPDPLRFDPTRFLPESETREPHRHRYAWVPFGAGPRACIGQHFSLLEATLALAMIVRRFRLDAVPTTDHVRVDGAITLFPVEPLLSKVHAL